MTKAQIIQALECSEQYAQKMIDCTSDNYELRRLVAQKCHERQTRKGIMEVK